DRWTVRQVLHDPAEDHDWGIEATVELRASDAEGSPVVRVDHVRPLGEGANHQDAARSS
ncbi:MAG: DUF3516 domain-containing protein, partial [Acidimicrobiales bacterium]|nr:DUF3516 domain-containing protein [Acidimicrobiales bacterium]